MADHPITKPVCSAGSGLTEVGKRSGCCWVPTSLPPRLRFGRLPLRARPPSKRKPSGLSPALRPRTRCRVCLPRGAGAEWCAEVASKSSGLGSLRRGRGCRRLRRSLNRTASRHASPEVKLRQRRVRNPRQPSDHLVGTGRAEARPHGDRQVHPSVTAAKVRAKDRIIQRRCSGKRLARAVLQPWAVT